jgi:hypothetical protein
MKQWTFLDAYIARIKEKTPTYPEVLIEATKISEVEYGYTVGTMVRVFRRGLWWRAMVLETLRYEPPVRDIDRLFHGFYMRFQSNIYKTIYLYQLCGNEDLDPDQTPETERLQKLTGI